VGGVCTICGGSAEEYCKHEYEKGICIHCNYLCTHNYENGYCSICGIKEDERRSWPNTSTDKSNYPLETAVDDLLVLVNKEWMVGRNYVPNDLVAISNYVVGVGDTSQKTNCMRKIAASALEEMFAAASADGISIKLRTGYRSYEYQNNLFNSYANRHGSEEANKYSAKPGQSEHQTGLACDLCGESDGYALSDYFGNTVEGKWVKAHCWEYGFILRYTDGTLNNVGKYTGYVYEAWHIRYVGKEAAKIITEKGLTLEEYLAEIEDAYKDMQ